MGLNGTTSFCAVFSDSPLLASAAAGTICTSRPFHSLTDSIDVLHDGRMLSDGWKREERSLVQDETFKLMPCMQVNEFRDIFSPSDKCSRSGSRSSSSDQKVSISDDQEETDFLSLISLTSLSIHSCKVREVREQEKQQVA
jgi:hypothetical protein